MPQRHAGTVQACFDRAGVDAQALSGLVRVQLCNVPQQEHASVSFGKLVDAGSLSKSDSQFVENTIEVLDLVLREAGDLKDYIGSGKQADAQAYDSSRKKALKEIKTLLSIKD